MAGRYDVVVIGGGLGGLTAGAMLARAGRKVLLIERNSSFGGAASTYKVGDLVVEAALHETADPRNATDPRRTVLGDLGLLETLEWAPTGALYEVRGGPLGEPFALPAGFGAAHEALTTRFPKSRAGIEDTLAAMENAARDAGAAGALPRFTGARSLGETFADAFGNEEGPKFALAANLAYTHDDPGALSWEMFAAAQGNFLTSGGRYVRGGSQRLSNALARAIRSAGGEIRTGRNATEIRVGAEGGAVVVHVDKRGEDAIEAETAAVASNAAPGIVSAMLEPAARERFDAAYTGRALSTSLFSVMFGLSRPMREFGAHSYATVIVPPWLQRFSDLPRNAELLAARPSGDADPMLTMADYTAIDSGLGGPPYPVSVIGFDRTANWARLDRDSLEAKRKAWTARIAAIIDANFPGFSESIVSSAFSTALSMQRYLNAPQGAVYGFAPTPGGGPRTPQTPIPGLFLASSYAAYGGFTGAILGGAAAARCILGAR